jgi:peptide/nickel transport system substrate-binding protein
VLRRGVAVVALLTACGLIAGCSSGTDDSNRLRVALPFAPKQELSQWGEDAGLLTQLGVAETLMRLDEHHQAQPLLAQDWIRQMDRSWRIRLRENVMFHDGLKLTADAAARALNHAAQATPVPRALEGVQIRARAVGNLDLEISTDRPDPAFLERLTSPNLAILSPAVYQGGGKGMAMGTGPFKIVGRHGGDRLRLDPFGSYRGGKPALSGVDAQLVPDGTARSAALRRGDIDVATALPISALPETGLQDIPLPRTTSLYLNTVKAPFADPALRAVVAGAVDRQALVRSVYRGHADVARTVLREQGPVAASASGNATGQKIVLATYNDRIELPEAASVVAQALRDKGFQVEQVVRPYRQLEPDLLAGRFDAALVSRSYLLDNSDPVAYFASDFSCSGGYNLARLCDPTLDATMATLFRAPDRARAASEIESAVLATGAIVPLVHEHGFIGHGDRVTGVQADPYERTLITETTALR